MQYFKRSRQGHFSFLLVGMALLMAAQVEGQIYPVDSIMKNGSRLNRINLVFLGDGYKAEELDKYLVDATKISNDLFRQAPFAQYKSFFNVYAIKVASPESGAKHPGTALDESLAGGQPLTDPQNFFQSTFDYAGIHRLLVPLSKTDVYNTLANNLPDYDQVFVVVNSPFYGGSGGNLSVASTHSQSSEIAIHEIGHSFASLADEYLGGGNYEAPNLTQNNNPETIRWKKWLRINNVGIYPIGPSSSGSPFYRPHQACKMRALGNPFCPVCIERSIDVIHQQVNMIDSYAPVATSLTVTSNKPLAFSVAVIQNEPSTILVNWYLNQSKTPFATGQTAVSVPVSWLKNGTNTVRVEVIDQTSLSKTYLPGAGYINSLMWTVQKPVVQPVTLISFSGKMTGEDAQLEWEVNRSTGLKGFQLEKSRDGRHFKAFAFVAAKEGKTSYSFTDRDYALPLTFYRLKMVEAAGGSTRESSVVRVMYPLEKLVYKVYQNSYAHKYQVALFLSQFKKVTIKVFNAQGVQVFAKKFGDRNSYMSFELDLSKYPPGIYYLQITLDNQQYTVTLVAR